MFHICQSASRSHHLKTFTNFFGRNTSADFLARRRSTREGFSLRFLSYNKMIILASQGCFIFKQLRYVSLLLLRFHDNFLAARIRPERTIFLIFLCRLREFSSLKNVSDHREKIKVREINFPNVLLDQHQQERNVTQVFS